MRRFVKLYAAAAALTAASLVAAPAVQARMIFDVAPIELETAAVTPPVVSHLPTWVQSIAVEGASLYDSDSGSDLVGQRLARYTFLRVLGSGASRLQVDAYDESGNPVQRGWVDPNQVLPSAPGTDWLVAASVTALWSAPNPNEAAVRNLDQFTPLQKLDGPVQERIEVRVYRPDFSGVVDQGWIDMSNAGPAVAPHTSVPSPTERPVGLRSLNSTSQQQSFLDAAAQAAREGAAQTGVPASVTVAQAILESDWGRSGLSVSANNYFGMKAIGSLGSDGVVYMPTWEYDASGELYETVSAFRAYKSLTDSMADHDRLLQQAPRYARAMKAANDPKRFATVLAEAGYSTDPAYADKLIALMDRYDLYQLDA